MTRTAGERLRAQLRAAQPPGPSASSSALEIARIGVLRAVDALVAAALVELFVTPDGSDWPARRYVAVARTIQDAIVDDTKAGGSAEIDALWKRLNEEATR